MKVITTAWQSGVNNIAAKQNASPAPDAQASAAPQEIRQKPLTDTLFLSASSSAKAADKAAGQAVREEEADDGIRSLLQSLEQAEEKTNSLFTPASQSSDSDSSFMTKSSGKGESVGQLAALLARAETRIDVLQVSSKVTRAILDLKMAAAGAKGDEAKKLAQQIKRYEKLEKRINKKLQHLAKEEQLEIRRKRAIKQMEFEKEKEISEELKTRRSKRRKDEKNYAARELDEDQKTADAEMAASMTGSTGGGDAALAAVMDFAMGGGMDISSLGGDVVSFDAIG